MAPPSPPPRLPPRATCTEATPPPTRRLSLFPRFLRLLSWPPMPRLRSPSLLPTPALDGRSQQQQRRRPQPSHPPLPPLPPLSMPVPLPWVMMQPVPTCPHLPPPLLLLLSCTSRHRRRRPTRPTLRTSRPPPGPLRLPRPTPLLRLLPPSWRLTVPHGCQQAVQRPRMRRAPPCGTRCLAARPGAWPSPPRPLRTWAGRAGARLLRPSSATPLGRRAGGAPVLMPRVRARAPHGRRAGGGAATMPAGERRRPRLPMPERKIRCPGTGLGVWRARASPLRFQGAMSKQPLPRQPTCPPLNQSSAIAFDAGGSAVTLVRSCAVAAAATEYAGASSAGAASGSGCGGSPPTSRGRHP